MFAKGGTYILNVDHGSPVLLLRLFAAPVRPTLAPLVGQPCLVVLPLLELEITYTPVRLIIASIMKVGAIETSPQCVNI